MKPFFSVIIPTYNRAHLIPKAIESVLQQSFSDWELLVIDDGSTDNTQNVVLEYSDKRLKYIHQKNAERSAARNTGIENSDGKYLCFLDSDDYYLSNRLELLHSEITKQGEQAAFYYTGITYSENEKLSNSKEFKNTFGNKFDFIVQAAICSQQACIHHQILKKHRYNPQFRIGEDMELWLRIINEYPIIYLSDQYTVVLTHHDDRSVNVDRWNVYAEYLITLRYVFSKNHIGHRISRKVKSLLTSNCYFGIARYFIHTNNKWQGVKNLLIALFAKPFHFQTKYRLLVLLKLLSINGLTKAKLLIAN